MNKAIFKKLRSEYRRIEFNVFQEAQEHLGDAKDFYVENVGLRREAFALTHGRDVELFLCKCVKPNLRELMVSIKIFAHLDYPFDKHQEPQYN